MALYKDTSELLRKRLREDLGLPDNDFANTVIESVIFLAEQECAKVAPIANRYPELFCPWDGKMHWSPVCDSKMGMGK